MTKKKTKVDPLLEVEETEDVEEVKKEVKVSTKVDKKETLTLSSDPAVNTKNKLAKGEHVNFIIPMATGEKPGAYEVVSINGYRLTIQKGVMVNIPIAIANLIAEKYKINMEAGSDKKINRSALTTEVLG